MYRTKLHYLVAFAVVVAFVLALPNGRTALVDWLNFGWKDTLAYSKSSVLAAKGKVSNFGTAFVEGESRNKEWRGTDSWVRYISPGTSYSDVWPITIIRWVDGDTVDVVYNQKNVRIRLLGVDTFETKDGPKMRKDAATFNRSPISLARLGMSAKRAAEKMMPPRSAAGISFDGARPTTDRYGRTLAYIHHKDGIVLNEALVKSGYARVWGVNSKNTIVYKALEAKSKFNKKGIWKYL